MAERDCVGPVGLENRLGVLPCGRPGRGVPRVPDREIAVEGREGGFVEDLAHEAEVLVDEDVAAVGDGDPRRFLAAVLLREQSEVGEARDLVSGCPDPEEATLVLR